MSEISRAQALAEQLQQVRDKTDQALRIRKKLIGRISQACTILEKEPYNRRAQQVLINNLDREKRFLDIMRRGHKKGISILKKIRRKIGRIKNPRYIPIKDETIDMISNLIDSMRFVHKKVKVIEIRVKKGEILAKRLAEKRTSTKQLRKFIDTLEEERELDQELAARLEK